MPRALTIQRTLVTPPDRKKYYERLKRKMEYYASVNCRFWVFEEAALPGAFLEFFEADDRETLSRAHESAPDRVLDPNRIYREVVIRELS